MFEIKVEKLEKMFFLLKIIRTANMPCRNTLLYLLPDFPGCRNDDRKIFTF